MIPGTRYNPATDAYEWIHDPARVIVSMKPDRVGICLPPADEDECTQTYWMDLMSAQRVAHAILHAQPVDVMGGGDDVFWSFWVTVAPAQGGLTLSTRAYGPVTAMFVPAAHTRALSDALCNAVTVAGNPYAYRDPGWQDICNSMMEATRQLERLGLNDGYIKAFLR